MKGKKRSLVVVVVALMAVYAVLGGASAQKTGNDKPASGGSRWSVLDNVDALKANLETAGFSLTPGEFVAYDLAQETREGEPEAVSPHEAHQAKQAGQPLTWIRPGSVYRQHEHR